jgi:hypothetical protein
MHDSLHEPSERPNSPRRVPSRTAVRGIWRGSRVIDYLIRSGRIGGMEVGDGPTVA